MHLRGILVFVCVLVRQRESELYAQRERRGPEMLPKHMTAM